MTVRIDGGPGRQQTADLANEWALRAVMEITRETGRLTAPQAAFSDQPDLHITPTDADAIRRLEAAAEIGAAARRLAIGYAHRARGTGHSWEEIGAALGPAADGLISIAGIRALFKLGRTAAYELTHRPGFPASVPVSRRCLRWWASEVEAYADTLQREGPERSTRRATTYQVSHPGPSERRITGTVRAAHSRKQAL